MEIFFSPYTLRPLKRLNRSSNMDPKHGIFLKGVDGDRVTFADYFPHAAFGDKGCELFLKEFKQQNDSYSRKVLHLLKKDHLYSRIPDIRFMNHQLWTGTEDLESRTIKYKMLRADDRTFMDPLKRGLRLRLDTNAIFNREGFMRFFQSIPSEHQAQIDYIEDPVLEDDWRDLPVKTAQDIKHGSPFDVYIYRPNCEFLPTLPQKIIFSSYLGSDLGRWHCYCELVESGNLNDIHGIISKGFYDDEIFLFEGNYTEGFAPDPSKIKLVYQHLHQRFWEPLCQI